MAQGFFVTFEGGEGAGKSTQITLLAQRLQGEGYRVRCLREPGGTPIGEELRHMLKYRSPDLSPLCAETELLLMQGSRAQLVHKVIRPALRAGEIVLCDRFYDSTVAYQGHGRGLSLEAIHQMNAFVVGETKPYLTYFFAVPPLLGLQRRRMGATALPDRFDEADRAFHERVYRGFQEIARAEPARIVTIPPFEGDVQAMHECIYALFVERYAQRNP